MAEAALRAWMVWRIRDKPTEGRREVMEGWTDMYRSWYGGWQKGRREGVSVRICGPGYMFRLGVGIGWGERCGN